MSIDRFVVVGYLIPSNTGRSFKVFIDGVFHGLVSRDALHKALHSYPMRQVTICRFAEFPQPKQTRQVTLKVCDPEKLKVGIQP